MNATLDLDEVLELLIGELRTMFSFEGIAILLLTDDRSRLVTRKLLIPNMPPDRVEAIKRENEAIPVRVPEGGGVARAVLEKRDFFFNEIDPQRLPEGTNKDAVVKTRLRSVLIMPLLVDDDVIGVMVMSGYNSTLDFNDDDIVSIRRFVDQISQALKNSHLHESLRATTERLDRRTRELALANSKLSKQARLLEEMSTTDELTGIRNRRHFFERASEELERCRRQFTELYLFMIDLDDFKKTNDSHGHRCGDAVLKSVAQAIDGVIRTGDLFARYGGEEFVVASVDNDTPGAAALAERIRETVESQIFEFEGLTLTLTASIGFARFPQPNKPQQTLDDMIREADEALYRAKRAGKNRCIPSLAASGTIGRGETR